MRTRAADRNRELKRAVMNVISLRQVYYYLLSQNITVILLRIKTKPLNISSQEIIIIYCLINKIDKRTRN